MNPLVWTSVGALASSVFWLLAILAGRDVYDAIRRRWPTARQRHTLPSVRADRFDATESEVITFVDDLVTIHQPADWLDEAPAPRVLQVPIIPGPPVYRPRHSREDFTVEFDAIAARNGAPVREHGPRESSLAELWVSAT